MMDWSDLAGERAGSIFRRAIYVVNDYAAAYPSLTVTWQVLGAGGEVLPGGTVACAALPNSLRQVGEVTWASPQLAAPAVCHSPSNARNPSPATTTPCTSTSFRPLMALIVPMARQPGGGGAEA